jgi:hypothetical protein
MDSLTRPPGGRRWLTSLLIISVLAAQAGVAVARPAFGRIRAGWPFVNYWMYAEAHFPGEVMQTYKLTGIRQDGAEVPLSMQDLRVTEVKFNRFVNAMLATNDAFVEDFLEAMLDSTASMQSIRIEAERYLTTGRDAVPQADTTLGLYILKGRP